MSDKHLPGLSFLDALRPPPGWRVDRALISTYSAEPAAIAAALLALAGRDDERGSGSRVGLAHALLELRGRAFVILQRGRLTAPRQGGAALRILDRFVREVHWNEGRDEEGEGRSWHPKCAVARLENEEGDGVLWRLHLGSRNLTRDLSWDMGLRIDGSRDDTGQAVPGLGKVIERLADKASVHDSWIPLVRELRSVRWDVPRGLSIRNLELMLPDDKGRGLPAAPDGTRRLVAVSPFLDGGAVAEVAKWGGSEASRSLISTRSALAPLAKQEKRPLKPFAPLLVLPATPEGQETAVEPEDESADATIEERGLHAKFLWVEHSAGATLWLGSANLTQRGWKRNAELVAEIEVERRGGASAARELEEGILAFHDYGEKVEEEDLVNDMPETVTDLDRLEEARRSVAAKLDARQLLGAEGMVMVSCLAPPHAEDTGIMLSIGPVAGALTEWPRGQAEVVLTGASAETPTELLVVQIVLNGERLSWTQRIAFDPPLSSGRLDQRDVSALAEWLGASGMLAAVRDLLDGTGDGEGGGRWDEPDKADRHASRGAAPQAPRDSPTIEQVLRAWMRDPQRLALVDQLLSKAPAASANPGEEAARRQLEAFRRTWSTLRASLGEASRGN
jgi:hypothetical protein